MDRVQNRSGWSCLSFPLLLTTICLPACHSDREQLSFANQALERETLITLNRKVWSAGLTSASEQQVWLAGHGGRRGIELLEQTHSHLWQLTQLIPSGNDRHDCVSADFNSDGRQDFYCSTGADRGHGENSAELWIKNSVGEFENEAAAWGVAERDARGRLVAVSDIDLDGSPDLVTSAWIHPTNQDAGSGKIWRNQGGAFDLVHSSAAPAFGARCLQEIDIDLNGFPDFVGCNAQKGLTLLLNEDGASFRESSFDLPSNAGAKPSWWWALAVDSNRDGSMIAGIGGNPGRQFIDLSYINGPFVLSGIRSFDCIQKAVDATSNIYCADVLFVDINDDGHKDLWVLRQSGWREEVDGDTGDIILLAPDFESFIFVPPAADGATFKILPINTGFIEITAGASRTGSVNLIRKLSRPSPEPTPMPGLSD